MQQRRLAATRRSAHCDILAGVHPQRDVAQRRDRPGGHRKETGDATRFDDGHQPTTSRLSVAAIGNRVASHTGYPAAAAAVTANSMACNITARHWKTKKCRR